MLTYLPYIAEEYDTSRDFYDECSYILRPQHVSEQRMVNQAIMITLLKFPGPHFDPGIEMWRGFEWSLLQYQEAICDHWIENLGGPRDEGGSDSYYEATQKLYFDNLPYGEQFDDPPWLGDEEISFSHLSNLIRIDPTYYRKRFPGVPDNLPYVWPK